MASAGSMLSATVVSLARKFIPIISAIQLLNREMCIAYTSGHTEEQPLGDAVIPDKITFQKIIY